MDARPHHAYRSRSDTMGGLQRRGAHSESDEAKEVVVFEHGPLDGQVLELACLQRLLRRRSAVLHQPLCHSQLEHLLFCVSHSILAATRLAHASHASHSSCTCIPLALHMHPSAPPAPSAYLHTHMHASNGAHTDSRGVYVGVYVCMRIDICMQMCM